MPFTDDLLAWYDVHARVLPWRGEKDPYRIWVSEIMLQQTRVEKVRGYYDRFIARFPTVRDLAAASEDEVLKLWEGLGYYSRARKLHAAARLIVDEMRGVFPRPGRDLERLPGIGPYTNAAISSIAYGEPRPALDGNYLRILTRVMAWQDTVADPFDMSDAIRFYFDESRPGDYNQAMMDLGATVCTPKSPKCGECPVSGYCEAFKTDTVMDFPIKPPPTPKRDEDWTIALVCVDGRVAVHRRPATGLLARLYEFVAVEGHPEPGALLQTLSEMGFSHPRDPLPLPEARHVFTHLIWHMRGWRVDCDSCPPGYTPVPPEALDSLTFPSALKTYKTIAAQR